MMQKAQVFSLERNTSVRNRLTHTLEVADVGRNIAFQLGRLLEKTNKATADDTKCLMSIVENACLMHDIGNPPFGHFGEKAIRQWFEEQAPSVFDKRQEQLQLQLKLENSDLYDFIHFDGNPQGFRIVSTLHNEIDEFGLNLTHSTLLASVKYPQIGKIKPKTLFSKKLGVFSSEENIYNEICGETNHPVGKRYFATYLMELADDICYCLSDIADAFEKGVIDSRLFKEEFRNICKEASATDLAKKFIPNEPIANFSHEVAIPASRQCVSEAASHVAHNLDAFLNGEAEELMDIIDTARIFRCLKTFAKRYIYTSPEAQKIEIAGFRIVHGLLSHFGQLLHLSENEFVHFVKHNTMPDNSDRELEWRVYNQLSPRMIQAYRTNLRKPEGKEKEWFERCRLIVDYVSGLTDQSALRMYQNVEGISLDN